MHSSKNLMVFSAVLLWLHFNSVTADTTVTGIVLCDQCKDGHSSFFDYPLSGATVSVTCDGAVTTEDTNWFGSYIVRFDGMPDLTECSAQVVRGPERCGSAAGPAKSLNKVFQMFGMAMYTVEPLLSQPQSPMDFCPHSSQTPQLPFLPPSSRPVRRASPLLPPPSPILPLFQASACPYYKWMMSQYRCYWRVVNPDTSVAIAFGPIAAGRYGMDMTLWEGLQGRGDLYRTLLREATTSLLNSYNTLAFFYPTITVIDNMNRALLGTRRDAVVTALRFRRANYGSSGRNVTCNFSTCS